MNFRFKKNNNAPDFWLEYLRLFDKKPQKLSPGIRLIALDTETTGFDYEADRILSIGAVAVTNNAINVSDQLEIYLKQEVFNVDTVEIHGIRKNNDFEKVTEIAALQQFVKYIGNATLIAHHANFDRKMINSALQRHGLGSLKNTFLDTAVLFRNTKHLVYLNDQNKRYSLDELCNDLKISKSDRHTASGDAFITAMAFLKIVARLKKDKKINFEELSRLRTHLE